MEREDNKPSLSSPLIQACEEDVTKETGRNNHGIKGFKRKEIFKKVKKQIWLGGPLICLSLLQYSTQIMAVMFVGHLGGLSLSGATMALSFTSVTGFSLLRQLEFIDIQEECIRSVVVEAQPKPHVVPDGPDLKESHPLSDKDWRCKETGNEAHSSTAGG
ncbi:hypothetical protein ACFX19_000007 [Malus domestica]